MAARLITTEAEPIIPEFYDDAKFLKEFEAISTKRMLEANDKISKMVVIHKIQVS